VCACWNCPPKAAALGSPGLAERTTPKAYACGFTQGVVAYELYYSIDDFTQQATVQSCLVARVADACQNAGITIGTPELNVRLARHATPCSAPTPMSLLSPARNSG
jgi:small-conductance mechanosensitive channel